MPIAWMTLTCGRYQAITGLRAQVLSTQVPILQTLRLGGMQSSSSEQRCRFIDKAWYTRVASVSLSEEEEEPDQFWHHFPRECTASQATQWNVVDSGLGAREIGLSEQCTLQVNAEQSI